jgi:UDP-N-acetylmuramate--alanine ligase
MTPRAVRGSEDRDWTLKPGDRVHFVGIGGIGLSAIARVLLQSGYSVSGSDLELSRITQELVQAGATIHAGHAAGNLEHASLVVVSSAIPGDNPEVVEARKRHIPVVKRGRLLAWLMKDRYGIAVAGTHGKTTTSAMIALILEDASLDPTIIVGGIVPELGANAKRGDGPHLVVEADEYDRTFLDLSPQAAVVTSIEMDHPDCFADVDDLLEAFRGFLSGLPSGGYLMANGDDPLVSELVAPLEGLQVSTYGFCEDADWKAADVQANALGGSDFHAIAHGEEKGSFQLSIPGVHNVSNALAAIGVADHLRLDLRRARETLRHFQGVERRFQIKGEAEGVTVVDDYAHHPSEIRATLAGARRRYDGRRIWVVFQPHTYSRTKALMADFASAFGDADKVVVTAIYGAREQKDTSISAKDLVRTMTHPHAIHIAGLSEVSAWVTDELERGDVLITMGAGDVWRVGEDVLASLQLREKAN